MDAVSVSTRACLAGLVLASLRLVCLRSSGGCSCVWSVRRCVGRLMVRLVCVNFIALLPVVVSRNVVCAAGTSVSALVSCFLVGPSAA